ncbi:MAG: hypothetical protein ACFFCW_34440 [Candidatus Hodarchaeota archaeon]
MAYHFDDFTEDSYRRLLQIAKKKYEIILFPDYRKAGKICIWRHDIDFSVHRSLALAKIEYEENFRSTYFINLHSNFYNVFEKEITQLLQKIVSFGHAMGVHFDPMYYALKIKTSDELAHYLKEEKRILAGLFGISTHCFSFHTPDVGGWTNVDVDEIEGMVNTYGRYLKENFGYCSDSNGYWRFRRLKDVLERAVDERLQVATHPSLWTPEVMAPRQRISRCIEGRARNQHKMYDAFLAECGRKNIRNASPQFEWLFEKNSELCLLIESLIAKNKHHLAFIELWRIQEHNLLDLFRAKKTPIKTANSDYEGNESSIGNYEILKETIRMYAHEITDLDMRKYQHWSGVRNKLVHGDNKFSKELILDGILYTIGIMRLFDLVG